MTPFEAVELGVAMLVAILALHWIAQRLRWPPSVALLAGGGAIAFMPGVPVVHIDPELVLVLFLPPLLGDGAWNTALFHFRRHFIGIVSLAVGAVLFTTLAVAAAAHWMMPDLPWAACAALGAIVSPPDAVSARALLQRVKLPRRLSTLLEGESLVNDATGLILLRFAVTAAMGGGVEPGAAAGWFVVLVLGGIAVGLAIGHLWVAMARYLDDELVLIVVTVLLAWVAYLAGEALAVSGVIATVTAVLVQGWYQHVILSAGTRRRGLSFSRVLNFLLEAAVFILIGFSLREVLDLAGGPGAVAHRMGPALLAVVAAMTVSRFVWVGASDALLRLLAALRIGREAPLGRAAGIVAAWAGMRGVVTLAAALTLPAAMPGRDFILVAAFTAILVTIVVQGSTLGLIIRLTGVRQTPADAGAIDFARAEYELARIKLAVVERLEQAGDSSAIHPALLAHYRLQVSVMESFIGTEAERDVAITAYFDVVLAAAAAARAELMRLHRANQIDDETLHSLEHGLDLEVLSTLRP